MNIVEVDSKRDLVTLYYATKPCGSLTEDGEAICNEYIYNTKVEAADSGYNYSVATWNDINMLADVGHCFPNVVIETPQGKFQWVEVYKEDCFGEEEVFDCVYRYYGAPDSFSEKVEHYLLWNKGSELQLITEAEGVFKAEIVNVEGAVIIIDG